MAALDYKSSQSGIQRHHQVIRILSLALAVLCVALVVLSVNIFSEKNRLDEKARQDTQALLLAAQDTPEPTPSQALIAQIPQKTPVPTNTTRPVILQDVDGYVIIAKISIDKLSLELPVISETTDEALKVAPCLFIGPSNPADAGNMVVTGHNNKDGSQFGKLKELKEGDAVTLMDKWGDMFNYEVYDIETITPDNVAALEEYEGDHALALVTCTSNGNRRLLLRCRMVENAVRSQ